MQVKSIAAAAALLFAAGAVSATQLADFGSHTVSYDETTAFGGLSSSFTAGDGVAGFTWTVPNSASVFNAGTADATVVRVDLPSFTVTANAGWALSNIQAFLGNLVYFEVGGATTGILIYGDVSVNGGPAMALSSGVNWVETSSSGMARSGYFGQTFGPGLSGGFTSISLTNAHMDLSAQGGVFSSIVAQPQNRLEVSLVAVPVPEPETYAMMLAGLGALGWLARRRRTQG